jgi:hypothetical protein
VLRKNLDWVTKYLKPPSLLQSTGRPRVFIERKLTFTDDQVRRVPHGKAVNAPAEVLDTPPEFLVRQ